MGREGAPVVKSQAECFPRTSLLVLAGAWKGEGRKENEPSFNAGDKSGVAVKEEGLGGHPRLVL